MQTRRVSSLLPLVQMTRSSSFATSGRSGLPCGSMTRSSLVRGRTSSFESCGSQIQYQTPHERRIHGAPLLRQSAGQGTRPCRSPRLSAPKEDTGKPHPRRLPIRWSPRRGSYLRHTAPARQAGSRLRAGSRIRHPQARGQCWAKRPARGTTWQTLARARESKGCRFSEGSRSCWLRCVCNAGVVNWLREQRADAEDAQRLPLALELHDDAGGFRYSPRATKATYPGHSTSRLGAQGMPSRCRTCEGGSGYAHSCTPAALVYN